MALPGEMTLHIVMSKDTSKVTENWLMHSILYTAQMPWLHHQSIKDNILWGTLITGRDIELLLSAVLSKLILTYLKMEM